MNNDAPGKTARVNVLITRKLKRRRRRYSTNVIDTEIIDLAIPYEKDPPDPQELHAQIINYCADHHYGWTVGGWALAPGGKHE